MPWIPTQAKWQVALAKWQDNFRKHERQDILWLNRLVLKLGGILPPDRGEHIRFRASQFTRKTFIVLIITLMIIPHSVLAYHNTSSAAKLSEACFFVIFGGFTLISVLTLHTRRGEIQQLLESYYQIRSLDQLKSRSTKSIRLKNDRLVYGANRFVIVSTMVAIFCIVLPGVIFDIYPKRKYFHRGSKAAGVASVEDIFGPIISHNMRNAGAEANAKRRVVKHAQLSAKENSRAELYKEKEKLLRDCVIHHQRLLQILKDASYVYKPALAFVMFCLFVAVSIVTLYATTITEINMTSGGILVFCFLGALLVLAVCLLSEEISTSSEDVRHAAYGCNWIDASPGFKQSIGLIITRGNNPFMLTAMHFQFSLRQYSEALKTAYSYYQVMDKTL